MLRGVIVEAIVIIHLNCFPQWLYHFAIPPAIFKFSSSFISHQHLLHSCYYYCCYYFHPRYKVVPHCGLDSCPASNYEFVDYCGWLCVSFEKCPFKYFITLKVALMCLLVLSCKIFISEYEALIRCMIRTCAFPLYRCHFYWSVIWCTKVFNFDDISFAWFFFSLFFALSFKQEGQKLEASPFLISGYITMLK